MARTRKIAISDELAELINTPFELENPEQLPEIDIWNEFIQTLPEDPIEQLPFQPKLQMLAGRVLYGGLNPKTIPADDLLFLARSFASRDQSYGEADYEARQKVTERIRGPLTGIRAFCINKCMNGQPGYVRSCDATTCAFWPFRMGNNPFFGKIPDAEVAAEEPEEEEANADQVA